MDTDLTAAYERCRELHTRHGRTYYLATRLLPRLEAAPRPRPLRVHPLRRRDRRRTEDLPPAERAAPPGRLGRAASSPACAASRSTTRCCRPCCTRSASSIWTWPTSRVPAQHGDGPDGHRRTATYDDLLDYMEGSAAVIGTMMLPILGSLATRRPPGSRPASSASPSSSPTSSATSAEDLERGRVYLPDEDLARFGVDPRATWPSRAPGPRHAGSGS